MTTNILILIFYFLGINLLTYTIYMYDKMQAINGRYRVSEQFLLILVVGGGTIGSLLSMLINRHKIKKVSFIIKFILANIIFLYLLIMHNQKILAFINSLLEL